MILSPWFLLRMRNVSDKSCGENQTAHFMFNPPPENRSIREIMWKNIVQRGRHQMKIWLMAIACWLTKVQTLRICNAYCFPLATMVARTRLDVTP